ncbi:peptidase M49, dipeptidyl-peptidase III [Polychaeton citri CBS 116435]|uniref:Peptidase M49, dipeptidyl-peptidase III n=1 Tax=Polychaeton citri CBS 116435 TaxID=1314669 RepID=A0A9P4Q3Q9_9PEZI|nr:peptidase M49, dipeptidyl-peptidase III [Polychaeton citri CBS 116435]
MSLVEKKHDEQSPQIVQLSPGDYTPIFDFIFELHRDCAGKWTELSSRLSLSEVELHKFLEYAVVFLQNIGNYYGHGDHKFVPDVADVVLAKLFIASKDARKLCLEMGTQMTSNPSSRTSYYVCVSVSADEITSISTTLEKSSVGLEDTRIRKSSQDGAHLYEVLQASVDGYHPFSQLGPEGADGIHLIRGDHSEDLTKICDAIISAKQHVANPIQEEYLSGLLLGFKTGDMEVYEKSQALWVEDQQPSAECVLSFVEPYRDPYGVRAELEWSVGIVHKQETEMSSEVIEQADDYIARLPSVTKSLHRDGNDPFESSTVGYRDFASLYTLAYCSTLMFPGINLPNFNGIHQQKGFRNLMITNSMDEQFLSHRRQTCYLWVVFHDLFGHGTVKLLAETGPGVYNFDVKHPPINPVTARPIDSWYLTGQTWTGVFGDIATSVDEYRAECIAAYLLSERDLVAAHFAIFRALLESGGDFMEVQEDAEWQKLTVSVDRSRILTHGRPALEALTLRLHMYRCTADIKTRRRFYEGLTEMFVQPNTFLENQDVVLRNYAPTIERLIQSWEECNV